MRLRRWWIALAGVAWVACATGGRTGQPPSPDAAPDGAAPQPDASVDCGDGVLDVGEECDDGNGQGGDGCSPSCFVEDGWSCAGEPTVCTSLCGNGVRDAGEACDGADLGGQDCTTVPGGFVGGTLACSGGCAFDTVGCVLASCGDGIVQAALGEQCDDGNTSNTDACLNACLNAYCGDGWLWAGQEECDDGNTTAGDGCSATCDAEYCGDGIVQAGLGEQCEGGSQACTTSCGTSGSRTCTGSCLWGSCAPPGETCNAVDDDCDGTVDTAGCLVQVWRFYNSATGDHMYKTSTTPDAGYQLETTHFKVYTTNVPGTHALYQRTNGTDHLLTYDPTEADGWYYGADILGYVAPNTTWSAAGYSSAEICRYYNSSSGDHMVYTYISNADLPTALPNYVREGCGNYVWDFH